jgi:DNA-binding NarL/FixJ family response regulator
MPLLIACKEFSRRSQPAQAQACLIQLNEQAQRYQTGEAAAALAEANGYLAEKSQPQAAAQHFRAAAEEWKKIGRPYDEGRALSSLSSALAAYGDQPSARQAAGQALRLFNDLADQLDPDSRAVFLNTPELLSLRQTVTGAPHHPIGPKADELTGRELEVLRLVAQGLTNAQIAERLVLSPLTVNSHLRSIFNKLDVTSRTAAAHVAMQRGWE